MNFYFLIHPPKTCSGTVRDIILNNMYSNESFYVADQFEAFKISKKNFLLSSADCFGHHFFLNQEAKFNYLTILRDPIDRLISEIFYMFYQTSDKRQYISKNNRIEKFVEIINSKKHLNYYVEHYSKFWAYFPCLNFNFPNDNKEKNSLIQKLISKSKNNDLSVLTKFIDFDNYLLDEKYKNSISNLNDFYDIFTFDKLSKYNSFFNKIIPHTFKSFFIKKNYFLNFLHQTPEKIKFDDLPYECKDQIITKTKYDYLIYDKFKS